MGDLINVMLQAVDLKPATGGASLHMPLSEVGRLLPLMDLDMAGRIRVLSFLSQCSEAGVSPEAWVALDSGYGLSLLDMAEPD